jgi:hypothetical protein
MAKKRFENAEDGVLELSLPVKISPHANAWNVIAAKSPSQGAIERQVNSPPPRDTGCARLYTTAMMCLPALRADARY